jgi:hypothetical protein
MNLTERPSKRAASRTVSGSWSTRLDAAYRKCEDDAKPTMKWLMERFILKLVPIGRRQSLIDPQSRRGCLLYRLFAVT